MPEVSEEYLHGLERLAAAAPTTAELSKLSEMGGRLYQLETDIIDTEDKLSVLKARRQEITTREMPDLFDEVGTDRIGLPGAEVDLVLRPYYHASLPRDDLERQEAGFKWLEENGHGDLIRATVTVEFTRREIDKARELVGKIEGLLGDEREVGIILGVHWQTLTAFVREQIERYQAALPLDLLGAVVGRVVKIEKRKK